MYARLFFRISLRFNAREAPRWSVSNDFKVRFCLAFLFIYSLISVYYIFAENARAFLKIF